MAQYTRAITNTLYDTVDTGALAEELQTAGLTGKLTQVSVSGTDIVVLTSSDLTAGEITTMDSTIAAHEGVPSAGTQRVGGGLIVEDLDDPSAPTVSVQGTTGSTTWGYKVSAFSDTGETLASSETQVTDGNATLSSANFNRVSWAPVVGAVNYGVYRSTAGGTPSSTGKIAETPLTQLDDTGRTASGSEPSEDLSGGLVVGTGTVSSSKHTTLKELTSDQSTVTSLLRLARRSSGTVAAGFGTGIYVVLDDAGGTLRDAGSLHFRWDDPAAGTLHTKARIQLRDGGTSADKDFEFNHNGKVTFDGSTLIESTTCKKTYGAGDLAITGNAEWYSNNNRLGVRLLNTGTGGFRLVLAVPQNYISGDLIFRLLYTVTATQATSRAIAYDFSWRGDVIGTTFETMHNEVDTHDTSSQIGDRPYALDLTLGSANFSKNDDFLSFLFQRLGDDAGDTCTTSFVVHAIQLQYTGWAFAGQAG